MDRKYNFEDFFNKSKEYYNNKNFKDIFNNIKKNIPYENSHEYWLLICEINLSRKNFEQANNDINNAIQLNNKSSRAWYLKARVSLGLMNYKKALRASERALSIENKKEYLELNQNIRNFLNYNPQEEKIPTKNKDFSSSKPHYSNKYDNMVIFTTPKGINLLSTKKLTRNIYYPILDNVIDEVLLNKQFSGDIFSKIIQFAESFVNIDYKSEGKEHGSYIFNSVNINAKLNTSHKIAAFIHELAHHFLSEIFEQAIMYIFDSVKTDTIEAFAWYAISQKPEWKLMNEYCAHTVECYFMPYDGYNYESFNNVLKESFDLNNPQDIKKIKKATEIGNTFAQDIIYMLNKFLTADLKNEIKIQYAKDHLYFTRHKGTKFMTNVKMVEEYKFDLINAILNEAIFDIKINFSYAQLYYFKKSFKNANRNL